MSLTSREELIVVHSHLRWDFVWQRPQQLLSRFAQHADVMFVEEPFYSSGLSAPRFEVSTPSPGVTRVVPFLPGPLQGQYDQSARLVRTQLQRMVGGHALVTHWFYTPMAAPVMLGAFRETTVVYDCMDELSAFRGAPPELARRERVLLAAADVVFAGGWRLWQAKSRWHDNVHFFGCGVDTAHFAPARDSATPEPGDVVGLPRPRFGYVGVIDERLDYQLLRDLARANQRGSVVMVGPRVKVHDSELPIEPNIHWLGARTYGELPAYIKAFDVCLMPFALNEATAYINPTKTLEYLAAGRPVVATAVADVVSRFASIVRVARSRHEFVEQCRASAKADESGRVNAGIEHAQGASWDSIVKQMRALLSAAADTPAETPIVA